MRQKTAPFADGNQGDADGREKRALTSILVRVIRPPVLLAILQDAALQRRGITLRGLRNVTKRSRQLEAMQRSRRNAGRTAGIYLPTGRQGPNVPRRFRRPPLLRGSIQNIQQSGPENGFEAEGDCVRRRQRGASCPGSGSRPGPASGTWSPRGATSETWSTRGAEMTISGPRGAETTAWRRRPSSLLEFISTRYGPLFFVRFVVGPSARDVIRGLRIGRKVERFSSVIPRFRGGVFGFFSFLSAAPLGLGGGAETILGNGRGLAENAGTGAG